VEQDNRSQGNRRWQLYAILLVCAAPVVLSYLTYYVIKPTGRTNYGTLIDPRAHPIPPLGATTLDGRPASLHDYRGKWILLQADGGACHAGCREKLYEMRQLRLVQGKDMDRIERVWLITDDQPLDTMLIRQFDGTRLLRARPDLVDAWLPVEPGTTAADHLFIIDPLGNLMMRFPKDADPNRIKKDIDKLLKASSIG